MFWTSTQHNQRSTAWYFEEFNAYGEFQEMRETLAVVSKRLQNIFVIDDISASRAADAFICFIHAKSQNPSIELVLPKIVDWYWHECIVDTRFYGELCRRHLDSFMHHRATLEDEETKSKAWKIFNVTLDLFRDRYGIDFAELGWTDPGWNKTIQLRDPLFWKPTLSIEKTNYARLSSDTERWLADRLTKRWLFTEVEARVAIQDYHSFLETKAMNRHQTTAPPYVDTAWREHILWTDKYIDHCERRFGFFVHRSP